MAFETIGNYPNMASNSNKKIGIFSGGHDNAYPVGAYLRILSPLNELSNQFDIYIIDENSFKQFFDDLKSNNLNLDVIIFQRENFGKLDLNFSFIESFFGKLKENNVKIIYDLDDDLLNIDSGHKNYELYSKSYETFKFMIINSDVVTVSTDYLKTQLIKFNENIVIVPNTLMKLWDFNPNSKIKDLTSKNTIKIGYFGSVTHEKDIQLIGEAIMMVKQYFKNKDIIFEVVGVCQQNQDWIKRIDLPQNYGDKPSILNKLKNVGAYFLNKFNILKVNLPYCSFIKFMKNEVDWDIGLAPLEDNNINRSKSNLKYLEYTALNIPGIYSNIGPYKDIGCKKSGLSLDDGEDWGNAIINLIENNELYQSLLKNAYEDINSNYLVENASVIWKDILDMC